MKGTMYVWGGWKRTSASTWQSRLPAQRTYRSMSSGTDPFATASRTLHLPMFVS